MTTRCRLWERFGGPAAFAEACALVEGRSADLYAAHGEPIPGWAWLNALAHRPSNELRALALLHPAQRWSWAAIEIADELARVDPAEASAVRAAVLLPAEVAAIRHEPANPDAIVRAVRRHVVTSRHASSVAQ